MNTPEQNSGRALVLLEDPHTVDLRDGILA